MTTADNITDAQIEALRTEAAQAGDKDMVLICDLALRGNRYSEGARAECASVIAEAESQRA